MARVFMRLEKNDLERYEGLPVMVCSERGVFKPFWALVYHGNVCGSSDTISIENLNSDEWYITVPAMLDEIENGAVVEQSLNKNSAEYATEEKKMALGILRKYGNEDKCLNISGELKSIEATWKKIRNELDLFDSKILDLIAVMRETNKSLDKKREI